MVGIDTEAILRFIRGRGPVLPVQIGKELNVNLMMAGAILSEMVSSGKLKVSKIKVGGSPLYYAVGQENRLTGFIQHLGPKERATYDLLRQKGMLRENEQDTITRVTLRAIKDFALPLTVTVDGTTETFWKWYLLSDQEAEMKIKGALGLIDAQSADTSPNTDAPRPPEPAASDLPMTTQAALPPPEHGGTISASIITSNPAKPSPVQGPPATGKQYDDEESAIPLTAPAQPTLNRIVQSFPPSKPNPAYPVPSSIQPDAPPKSPETRIAQPFHPTEEPSPTSSSAVAPLEPLQYKPLSPIKGPRKRRTTHQTALTTLTTPAASAEPAQRPPEVPSHSDDRFFMKISTFFTTNGVATQAITCNKRETDFEFIVRMPTTLGTMTIFCKAINKAKISESDLTAAFAQSQLKSLPGILLVTGDLTKKAQKLLETDLRGLTVKSL